MPLYLAKGSPVPERNPIAKHHSVQLWGLTRKISPWTQHETEPNHRQREHEDNSKDDAFEQEYDGSLSLGLVKYLEQFAVTQLIRILSQDLGLSLDDNAVVFFQLQDLLLLVAHELKSTINWPFSVS